MSRLSAIAVLGISCAGGPGGVDGQIAECRAAAKSDVCLAQLALDLTAEDPDGAKRAIRLMDAGLERDTAWFSFARATGAGVCGEIAGRDLRDHCLEVVGRLHLREAPKARASDPARPLSASAAEAIVDCPAAGRARDACVSRIARAAPVAPAIELCGALSTSDAKGECAVQLAERWGREDRVEDGRQVCDALTEERWVGECWFRLAESADGAPLAERAALCARATPFDDHCRTHLVAEVARLTVQAEQRRSFRELLPVLREANAELGQIFADRGGVREQRQGLFWMHAFDSVFRVVEAPSGLASLAGWRGELADQALIQGSFDDALLRRWVVVNSAALDAGVSQAGPDGLGWLLGRYDADLRARSPRSAAAPLVASGGRDLPIGDRRTALGRLPWPLDPIDGCGVTGDRRRAVIALWALSAGPVAVTRAAVAGALEGQDPTLSAYALTVVHARMFEWDRGGELDHQGLADLVTGARAHPDRWVQVFAAKLTPALAAGRDTAGPFPSLEFCRARRAAGSR